MTREEAAMRLKEEVLDQLYYDRHMMTLKEIESWLYKHNCDSSTGSTSSQGTRETGGEVDAYRS